MGKYYYAAQSPEGFENGVHVVRFTDKATRDRWVCAHKVGGPCNSPARGAYAVTFEEVRHVASTHSNSWMTDYNAE
jgi:hypothetical protein